MSGVDTDPGDALARLLGFEVLDRGPGRATLRAAVGPDHLNHHGTVHGGFVFTLADMAFSIAANDHGPPAVGLVAAIHHTRTAHEGQVLVAEAREISLGRAAATYEVTVTAEGRTVALFTGTVHRHPGTPTDG
jgi:acyl-CoA thioesterase